MCACTVPSRVVSSLTTVVVCGNAVTNPDWRCEKRELPSEKSKVTCEDLRARTNIYNRMCATQYESAGQCEGSFFSHNNVYRPCVWKAATRACEDSTQVLACDCALMHKDCPLQAAVVPNGVGVSAGRTKDVEDLSSGETAIVSVAIIVIVVGLSGLIW
jgi:hypothetical protein